MPKRVCWTHWRRTRGGAGRWGEAGPEAHFSGARDLWRNRDAGGAGGGEGAVEDWPDGGGRG